MANLAPNGYTATFAKTIREITGANTAEVDGAPDEGLVWFSSRGGSGSNQDIVNATADIAGKVRISSLPTSGDPIALTTTDKRVLPTVSATLPTSPVDGQLWIYRGSNFSWQFVYNASGGNYKWEFVGGGPQYATDTTSQTITLGTSYTGPPTATALVTPPFAGDYIVELECTGTLSAAGLVCSVSIGIGTSPETISDNNAAQVTTHTAGGAVSTYRFDQVTLAAANTYIAPRWKRGATTGTITLSKHAMKITPIRVG